MRDGLFAFLAGLIVGAFGLLIAHQTGLLPLDPAASSAGGGPGTDRTDEGAASPEPEDPGVEVDRRAAIRHELIEATGRSRRPMEAVLRTIDEGIFERDWARVEIATSVARELSYGNPAGSTASTDRDDGPEAGAPGPGETIASPLERSRDARPHLLRAGLRVDPGPVGRLWRAGDRRAVRRLVQRMRDGEPDGASRPAAFEALGAGAVEPDRPGAPPPRAEAVALALLPEAGGPEALIRLVEDPTLPAATRRDAAAALVLYGDPRADEVVDRLLDATDPDLRAMGVRVAARSPGGRHLAAVRDALLEDPEAPVREAAARALRGLDDAAARRSLLEAVRDDAAAPVRIAALEALEAAAAWSTAGRNDALAAVRSVIEGPAGSEVLRTAARVARVAGGAGGLRALESMAPSLEGDAAAEVRTWIAELRRADEER